MLATTIRPGECGLQAALIKGAFTISGIFDPLTWCPRKEERLISRLSPTLELSGNPSAAPAWMNCQQYYLAKL